MKFLNSFMLFAIAFLIAGIFYLSFLGTKDQSTQRDAKRRDDVQKILSATVVSLQNDKENVSIIPVGSCGESKEFEICRTGARSCEGLVNLSFLTVKAEYLTGIPTDPVGINENGSGYQIAQDTKGVITVCAPSTEGEKIRLSSM